MWGEPNARGALLTKRGIVTDTRAQTPPVIEYPVEFLPPDITPWRGGTTQVPFVHSFEAARSGPTF